LLWLAAVGGAEGGDKVVVEGALEGAVAAYIGTGLRFQRLPAILVVRAGAGTCGGHLGVEQRSVGMAWSLVVVAAAQGWGAI
jgi:hypothetical protein